MKQADWTGYVNMLPNHDRDTKPIAKYVEGYVLFSNDVPDLDGMIFKRGCFDKAALSEREIHQMNEQEYDTLVAKAAAWDRLMLDIPWWIDGRLDIPSPPDKELSALLRSERLTTAALKEEQGRAKEQIASLGIEVTRMTEAFRNCRDALRKERRKTKDAGKFIRAIKREFTISLETLSDERLMQEDWWE